MPDEMLIAMLINFVAFTILYVALVAARIDVAQVEAAIAPDESLAGDAVRPPRLNEVEDV